MYSDPIVYTIIGAIVKFTIPAGDAGTEIEDIHEMTCAGKPRNSKYMPEWR
jgi:hypothetical protein